LHISVKLCQCVRNVILCALYGAQLAVSQPRVETSPVVFLTELYAHFCVI